MALSEDIARRLGGGAGLIVVSFIAVYLPTASSNALGQKFKLASFLSKHFGTGSFD